MGWWRWDESGEQPCNRPRPSSLQKIITFTGGQSCGYRNPCTPEVHQASPTVSFTSEIPGQQGCEISRMRFRMKILGTLCTLALFLFLIAPAPGYSQDRDQDKPNQPQDEQKKDNDTARENGKAKQEDKAARPDENRRNDNPNMGQDDRQRRPEVNPQEQQQRDQQQREQRNDNREQQRPMNNDNRAVQQVIVTVTSTLAIAEDVFQMTSFVRTSAASITSMCSVSRS